MTKRRARVSDEISNDDAENLTAYFSRWQYMNQQSTQGGVQDRLEMTSLHLAQKWADDHDGGRSIYPEGEVTAYPTAEFVNTGGNDPELGPYAAHSSVLRRLGAVRKQEALLCEVLECYFGPIGAHWEDHAMGRIGSLYHLTAAGFALLRQEEARPAPKAGKHAADAAPAPKGPNRAERRAAVFGTSAPLPVNLARGERSETATVASAALESMMRTGHGRMLTLLSAKDLSDAVREGVARCELEALELLRRAGAEWNAADAELAEAVAGRVAR